MLEYDLVKEIQLAKSGQPDDFKIYVKGGSFDVLI